MQGGQSPGLEDVHPGHWSQLCHPFLCGLGQVTGFLGPGHRLHSHMDTCLLGSRNLETREEGMLGSVKAAPPCQRVTVSQSTMEGPSGERRAASLRAGRGGGEDTEGFGTLPSPEQVAVVRWPEIPSGLTEQALAPLSPELLGAQVPSFQEALGMLFLQRLTRNPVCPSVPEERGLVSQSLINVNGEAEGWPFSGGGVSMAWLTSPPQTAPCTSQTARDRATEGVSPREDCAVRLLTIR